MSKSVIIIVIAVWLINAVYLTVARNYNLPYAHASMVLSWVASALLLVCILAYINKQKRSK